MNLSSTICEFNKQDLGASSQTHLNLRGSELNIQIYRTFTVCSAGKTWSVTGDIRVLDFEASGKMDGKLFFRVRFSKICQFHKKKIKNNTLLK